MILITGGAGFLGSLVLKELNNLGREDIVVVDRLYDSIKWLNLRGLKYREYVHADDFFSGSFDHLFDEVDFIFHMGASSATTEMDMDYLMTNNLNYSKNLFTLATVKQIPIVYASSAATYGDGELGYDDNEEEISKLLPLNPYGYSKQLFDEWVLKQAERPKHWFGLKFFNVYGPNEYHKKEMRSLVHKAYEQILETGEVKLFKSHREGYEDGEQLRDFIYGVDAAKAMIEMMNPSSSKFSGIYNIGTGEARSFKDLVVATFKAMDKEVNITYIDMPEKLRGQYQYYTKAEMNKFLKFLPNFKFKSIEEGVTDYVQNYLMRDKPYA